ncbi:DUF2268 domain-containing putative Zn-dependent protease [Pontibacillus marinus]|uniref:DUF2268 domain-containing protein n=1 Tax=Pontibacillus marinus BH030004 = DSM 16465 TaxID=1385511 RepID=A0A0A5GKJ6_9BACI|nr:DUF2268 domain-containing putative Zn-dependent protease [Pontibacillus marinus]KGX91753.1 hypothetical protein N783_00415 [Pontibacillus marinus BH030004 = DSM 16465]
MSVIDTKAWLLSYFKKCQSASRHSLYELQSKTLVEPIESYVPDMYAEELLYHLHQNGLFQPGEWRRIEAVVKDMDKGKVWEIIKKEFQRLKNEWNGPDIPVFIFPIKHGDKPLQQRTIKKNGLALKQGIFLFISSDHPATELKAIFAHEYHHACRMHALDLDDQTLALKDLLVLEGLAECAVKDHYGEKWLAPWTSLYTYEEVESVWQKQFKSALSNTDPDHQYRLMYGKKLSRFPKWIGYNIGYQIVQDYLDQQNHSDHRKLLKEPADTIIKESKFDEGA